MSYDRFDILPTPVFERDIKRLAKKYPSIKNDLGKLVDELAIIPTQGVSLGKSCYKIRLAITSKGKGKSGGARIITFVYVENHIIYLLSIYDKSEKEDLSTNEIAELLYQVDF